jgi:hypothetical protein
MNRLDNRDDEQSTAQESLISRLFIREPGWRVERKIGSERENCHSIAPGDDVYHRLADGEIYIFRGDEKLCLRCADRQGLLTHEPKILRSPARGRDVGGSVPPGGYELSPRVGDTEA